MAESLFVPEHFSSRSFWAALLGKWLTLLSEYESVDPRNPDLAYWYGERPLTGLLGAAAWQIGGWSLEEFGAGRWKKRLAETRQGRGDLWLGCTRGDATGEVTVEAKILWAYQDAHDTLKTELDKRLKRARKQLRQLEPPDRVGEPFAVCYVVPCYAGPEGKQRGEGILARLADQTRREGMATATHLATIGNITDVDDKQRPMYPGVLLVADQAEWRDR
jgi:hypothetical protein